MKNKHLTLGEFIIDNQNSFRYSTGELSRLINSIRLAAKVVNHVIRKAGLSEFIGDYGGVNVHGEKQKKLDVLANDLFKQTLINREIVCGIASEEDENFIRIKDDNKYVLLMDPLDGSSNIDVNVSLGTIFSIYRRISPEGTPVVLDDFLQKGKHQIAAGYVIYGTSTILVFTTGNGVNGFTFNPAIGAFYLSHPNIHCPKKGSIYSINEGYQEYFSDNINAYLTYCKSENKKENRPYTARYIGSLVSDFHRNMIKGGVYLYPNHKKSLKGKLRLLYECNPMAFICEQSGGRATDGKHRIMDIKPSSLHQSIPFYCGSHTMVDEIERFLQAE